MKSRIIAAIVLSFLSCAALAANGFSKGPIWLLSPLPVIEARAGKSPKPLADYMTAVMTTTANYLTRLETPLNFNGAVFVAVRPGRQSRAWLETSDASLHGTQRGVLVVLIEKLPPIDVEDGPIAFGMSFTVGKNRAKLESAEGLPYPLPAAWVEAMKTMESGLFPDAVLEKVWPR